MKKAIITTSWDDGHPLDLKLAQLLKKYDVPATFYISINNDMGWQPMNFKQIRRLSQDFDIGAHTVNHVYLNEVSIEKATDEIIGGKKILEEICGKEVISFAYPRGYSNPEIIQLVKKSGFKGARTTESFLRRVNDLFRLGVTSLAYDGSKKGHVHAFLNTVYMQDFNFSLFLTKNCLFFKKPWSQIAIKTLEFVSKNGGIWHLCGHSWDIENNQHWNQLKTIFRKIKSIKKEYDVTLLNNSDLIEALAGTSKFTTNT
ncbi:hypothetical protein D4R86_03150 [bacterium]|nr:MAG: hypothetical protein D4R86_03150 [bacterium]